MENPRNPDRLSIEEFETKVLRGLYGIPVTPDSPKDDSFLRSVVGKLNDNSQRISRVVGEGIDPDAIYRNDWLPRAGKWARR